MKITTRLQTSRNMSPERDKVMGASSTVGVCAHASIHTQTHRYRHTDTDTHTLGLMKYDSVDLAGICRELDWVHWWSCRQRCRLRKSSNGQSYDGNGYGKSENHDMNEQKE